MSDRYALQLERYPALGLIGNTPLLRVMLPGLPNNGSQIWAKTEWLNPGGSIKDRPVMRMLLEAQAAGELTKGRTILDSSSGNAGIAYAMIGAILGVPVELVVPGNASSERKRRIRAHGATLVQTDPIDGYDAALREAHRRRDADPAQYFMPDQYANDNNWRAHFETTAVEILAQTDNRVTHFVAGIGTGGTITGVGRKLKSVSKSIEVVCVRPDVFPGIEGLKPLGSPEDIVPAILDRSVIDQEIPVNIEEAYDHCHRLAQAGIFVGQSSGAYLKAAMDVARDNPNAVVVTVFSDLGERYFSTGMWSQA